MGLDGPAGNQEENNSPGQQMIMSKVVSGILATQQPIYDLDLSRQIEAALTVESADMVLVTLRRIDEVILNAPHMIVHWEKLLERLVELDPDLAYGYVTEMSLHWNPVFAESVIDKQRIIYGSNPQFQHFCDAMHGVEAVGNEVDEIGIGAWVRLTMERASRMDVSDVISSFFDIFQDTLGEREYVRTPYGTSRSRGFGNYINPFFRQRAAETALLLLPELTNRNPAEGVEMTLLTTNLFTEEECTSLQDQFFHEWVRRIMLIASKDVKKALASVKAGFSRTFGTCMKRRGEIEKRIRAYKPRNIGTGVENIKGPFERAQEWAYNVNNPRFAKEWREIILRIAKRDPQLAIDEIYDSISPFRTVSLSDHFGYIVQTLISVIDPVFETDIVRGISLCESALSRNYYAFFSPARQDLFERIVVHGVSITSSHPDLILNTLVTMDCALKASTGWGEAGVNYSDGAHERHTNILEIIPLAVDKSLIVAIRGCERLLLFADRNGTTYAQAVNLWRKYMAQLEMRHAYTAGLCYSQLHSEMRNIDHPLTLEAAQGFNRCIKGKELQARTMLPLPLAK